MLSTIEKPPPVKRSYLFVPGNRPDRFSKAYAASADAVIIDLEDAIPPDEKVAARDSVRKWLSPAHPVFIRVNSAGSEWVGDDVTLCAEQGSSGMLCPKA